MTGTPNCSLSLGGFTALVAAASLQDQVKGVVLLNSAGQFGDATNTTPETETEDNVVQKFVVKPLKEAFQRGFLGFLFWQAKQPARVESVLKSVCLLHKTFFLFACPLLISKCFFCFYLQSIREECSSLVKFKLNRIFLIFSWSWICPNRAFCLVALLNIFPLTWCISCWKHNHQEMGNRRSINHLVSSMKIKNRIKESISNNEHIYVCWFISGVCELCKCG